MTIPRYFAVLAEEARRPALPLSGYVYLWRVPGSAVPSWLPERALPGLKLRQMKAEEVRPGERVLTYLGDRWWGTVWWGSDAA